MCHREEAPHVTRKYRWVIPEVNYLNFFMPTPAMKVILVTFVSARKPIAL